jgi:hypothetical protein
MELFMLFLKIYLGSLIASMGLFALFLTLGILNKKYKEKVNLLLKVLAKKGEIKISYFILFNPVFYICLDVLMATLLVTNANVVNKAVNIILEALESV